MAPTGSAGSWIACPVGLGHSHPVRRRPCRGARSTISSEPCRRIACPVGAGHGAVDCRTEFVGCAHRFARARPSDLRSSVLGASELGRCHWRLCLGLCPPTAERDFLDPLPRLLSVVAGHPPAILSPWVAGPISVRLLRGFPGDQRIQLSRCGAVAGPLPGRAGLDPRLRVEPCLSRGSSLAGVMRVIGWAVG